MAKEAKRGGKTESLSLRIDPKTKFALEFMMRVTGLRITELIERAIKSLADRTTVGYGDEQKIWSDYWSADEGVRTLELIFDPNIENTFEEDELYAFVREHETFFGIRDGEAWGSGAFKVRTSLVHVLWPRIEEYLDHWRANKSKNRWATGKLMQEAIKAAGMKGPEWPPRIDDDQIKKVIF